MEDMQSIGLFDSETVQAIFYHALDRIEAEAGTSEISPEEVIDAVKFICVKVVEDAAQNMFWEPAQFYQTLPHKHMLT